MILRLIRGSGPPTNDDLKSDIRKMCSVFLHREQDTAIVATKFIDGGIFFEEFEAITKCSTEPGDMFGGTVRDCFIASKRRKLPKRDKKLTKKDWPTFQASGAKSVSQFDREWLHVLVTGLNDANIMVRMETDPVRSDVALTKICNPLVVERLGGDIRLLRKLFLKWEQT